MAAKTLSSLIGGGGVRLAPDLNYPLDNANTVYKVVSGIDCSAGLTTVLSLTGAWTIGSILITGLTVNDVALVKLTIDGVVIWNVDPNTNSTSSAVVGGGTSSANLLGIEDIRCDTSFLFEMETDVDTNLTMTWYSRPIL